MQRKTGAIRRKSPPGRCRRSWVFDVTLSEERHDRAYRLRDTLFDDAVRSPMERAERAESARDLGTALLALSPWQRVTLRLRYRVGVDEGRTLDHVGSMFELTRERVRQIESKALRQLRDPEIAAGLLPHLNRPKIETATTADAVDSGADQYWD